MKCTLPSNSHDRHIHGLIRPRAGKAPSQCRSRKNGSSLCGVLEKFTPGRLAHVNLLELPLESRREEVQRQSYFRRVSEASRLVLSVSAGAYSDGPSNLASLDLDSGAICR